MRTPLLGRRSRGTSWWAAIALLVGLLACTPRAPRSEPIPGSALPLTTEGFGAGEQALAQGILSRLEPLMEQRRRLGTQATLTFEELYAPLEAREADFLRRLGGVQPGALGIRTPFLGFGPPGLQLIRLDEVRVDGQGARVPLPPQYLPKRVHRAYQAMMAAMQADLGRRLYLASGYRSGAYQLYLFLSYLPSHGWSVRETARFVAFPGYSEHGDPTRQALDFVNGEDVSEQPGLFEQLPEYRWLTEHAARFGFVLSYPPGSPTGITFEPWHWHFEEPS